MKIGHLNSFYRFLHCYEQRIQQLLRPFWILFDIFVAAAQFLYFNIVY